MKVSYSYAESTRQSANGGASLFTVSYTPSTRVRAALCFHHGFGEHVGRYNKIFGTLAESGIAVYSGDAMGHGKSDGSRAYIDIQGMVTDFLGLCESARTEHGGKVPMFIGGHSLGGLIAAFSCLKTQEYWSGLLLCSPLLDVEWTPVLRFQALFSSVLAATMPKLRIVPKVVPSHVNKDPVRVKEYEDDPLIYHANIPVRSGSEMLKGFGDFSKHLEEFTLPIYGHHGTADKITSFEATKAFLNATSSTDTTFVPVEGGYHEVLQEPGGDALLERMIDWMTAKGKL
jgi:acylglycerol lipase